MKLACLLSADRALVIDFTQKKSTVITPSDLDTQSFYGLLYARGLEEGATLELLEKEVKFSPVIEAESLGIEAEQFSNLTLPEAEKVYLKMRDSWTLHNAISVLDELVDLANHLRELWREERATFFEELWFLLKTVLAPFELTLIHNELEAQEPQAEGAKSNQKMKLKQVKISGERLPLTADGGDNCAKLMQSYHGHFNHIFDLCEYSKERQEVVFAATVNKSPILIMAKLPSLSPLQRVVVKNLFELLQRDVLE